MIADITVNKIRANAGKRKIAALGWNEKYNEDLSMKGLDIVRCFTGNRNIIEKNTDFFSDFSEMNGKNNEFYIIVLVNNPDNPDSQKNLLKANGFSEVKDYIYLNPPSAKILDKKQNKYSDEYGNVVLNLPENTTVSVSGWGNKISFSEEISFKGKFIVKIIGNDNEFEIGKGFAVTESVMNISCTGDNNRMRIKENCKVLNSGGVSKIRLLGNALFSCGKNTIISGFEAGIVRNTFFEIGEDCLFSYFVVIQTGEEHSIFDIDTEENISSAAGKRKGVVLGNHVWVGMRAFLLPCTVGDGSVVGAQSVVKGKYPNNCALAGSPAKVVRKNIAWSSVNEAEDIAVCGEYVSPTDCSELRPGQKERIAELEGRVAELEEIIDELRSSKKRGLFRKHNI
ncbi:MAG: hypothetical protein MSH15_02990 [Oscillospiraceae bacterium]|nr:hypothetical protein [Oscillospiraceae bacterium]